MLGLALVMDLVFFSCRVISSSWVVPNGHASMVHLLPPASLSVQIDRGGGMAFLPLFVYE